MRCALLRRALYLGSPLSLWREINGTPMDHPHPRGPSPEPTSAVVDWSDGTLVEWRTNYAYGATESHWKNLEPDGDPKYGNAYEPYGFTGKEEDEAVGLHYFGARYYSSYLGRWLSPDAPVVHGGG
ncbi:MAG: hypothetical protein GY847_09570 [Proteobacteria bacterium]|nr:hypothetical protein [Pseudomonadota bacterium]